MTNKEKIVLLSHYDLDGAGCSVLADHIWNVVARKHQGYPKIRKHLDMLIADHGKGSSEPVKIIVIADLCIEPNDLKHALANFETVVYYDHHESSEQFTHWDDGNFDCHFSLEYCSTALMWMDGVKNWGAERTPDLDAFMNTVNAYDLWKKTNKRFKYGVILNDMFWELNLWDFKNRFADGFDGLTSLELTQAEDRTIYRRKVIKDAQIEEMDSGSKVVVLSDATAINFVSSILDGDIFYIIPPPYVEGQPPRNVSVRLSDEFAKGFNVNDAITTLAGNHPSVVEMAGGHAAAGGITFKPDVSVNTIVDFLFEYDSYMRKVGKV